MHCGRRLTVTLREKKILMTVGILQDKDVDEVLDNFSLSQMILSSQSRKIRRKLAAAQLAKMITAKGGIVL